MKKFENPIVEVVTFAVEDVVTTSPSQVGGTTTPDDEF